MTGSEKICETIKSIDLESAKDSFRLLTEKTDAGQPLLKELLTGDTGNSIGKLTKTLSDSDGFTKYCMYASRDILNAAGLDLRGKSEEELMTLYEKVFPLLFAMSIIPFICGAYAGIDSVAKTMDETVAK